MWVMIPFVLQGGEDTLWRQEEFQPCIFRILVEDISCKVDDGLAHRLKVCKCWSGCSWNVLRSWMVQMTHLVKGRKVMTRMLQRGGRGLV